jgi:hypothetical protein
VRFSSTPAIRIPVSTVLAALTAARAGEPSPVSDYATGLAIGLLLAFQDHGERHQLPAGAQLRAILREGGWLVIAPDGVWHLREGMKPARVIVFSAQEEKR